MLVSLKIAQPGYSDACFTAQKCFGRPQTEPVIIRLVFLYAESIGLRLVACLTSVCHGHWSNGLQRVRLAVPIVRLAS